MPRKAKAETAGDTPGTQQKAVSPIDNKALSPSYAVRRLRQLVSSDEVPAAAKAAALRTLAEIEGVVGRHQQAPQDRTAQHRVSALTRAELERELARLRTVCGVSPTATR
jgi:hypothetical protein